MLETIKTLYTSLAKRISASISAQSTLCGTYFGLSFAPPLAQVRSTFLINKIVEKNKWSVLTSAPYVSTVRSRIAINALSVEKTLATHVYQDSILKIMRSA